MSEVGRVAGPGSAPLQGACVSAVAPGRMHEHGVGVILDWVPAHFPGDEFALAWFDGTALFERQLPVGRDDLVIRGGVSIQRRSSSVTRVVGG